MSSIGDKLGIIKEDGLIFNHEEKYEIKFYMENGVSPVASWIEMLDARDRSQVDTRLARICSGNLGDIKSIGGQIYEIRFFFGPGYRLYFIFEGKVIILLLNAGSKNTQQKDIRIARARFVKYQSEEKYDKEDYNNGL